MTLERKACGSVARNQVNVRTELEPCVMNQFAHTQFIIGPHIALYRLPRGCWRIQCGQTLCKFRTTSRLGNLANQFGGSQQIDVATRPVWRGPGELECRVVASEFDRPVGVHQSRNHGGTKTDSPRSTLCKNAMAWRSAQRPSYPLAWARKAQCPPFAVSK